MKVELYSKVILNDGRKATVVDVLGDDYVADIEIDGGYDTQLISPDLIERVM